MPLLITIALLVLLLPLIIIVGIAAGPAALVMLFIAGWVLLVMGAVNMYRSARRRGVGPPPG